MAGLQYSPSVEQRVARALRVVDEAMNAVATHTADAVITAKLDVIRMTLQDIAPGVKAEAYPERKKAA